MSLVWSRTVAGSLIAAFAFSSVLTACSPARSGQQPSGGQPAPAGQAQQPSGQAQPPPAGQPSSAAPKPAANASAQVLKFNHVVAKDTPKHKTAEKFAELLKQKSNGKYEVQIYPNSELYKDGEEIEGLQQGAIHFIAPGPDKLAVIAPVWDAPALPGIFENDAAVQRFLDPNTPVAKEMFEALRAKNLLGMAIWFNGWKHFTNSKRPLKTADDFKGLKFRTSGKPDEAFVKALGGSAQVMAFSEVFSALQQGVVEGQYNTWSNVFTQKFHEVQKYATASRGGVMLSYPVATNAKWFDGLSAEDKKAVTDAMIEATAWGNKLGAKENEDAYEGIKKSGRTEIYEQTEADAKAWNEKAQDVVKQ
ncbi:MAG: DctP family TRAP transporter solute-binding subunit [Chloroflexi bacterium]|nr:DctP family TRAP transporter solute-binding subunit [Chloroflexota bacterium]